MGVEIRTVRPDECDLLGALLVEAYDTIPGAQVDPEYNESLGDVAGRIDSSTVLVATNAATILGGVTYTRGGTRFAQLAEPGDAEIRMFAVATSARGAGVGRSLLDACLELARSDKCTQVWLATSPWMIAAQQLYERAGFRRVPERDWSEISSGLRFELLAYALDLPPRD